MSTSLKPVYYTHLDVYKRQYLTTYDSFIFYNAIGEHPDYFYRPIAVAKQVVNGTNYRFMTIAEPEQSDLTPHFAIVEIYQPLEGRAYATKITPV